jgi:hypothetical protein
MDLKTIEAAVDICLNTMFLFDESGIKAWLLGKFNK